MQTVDVNKKVGSSHVVQITLRIYTIQPACPDQSVQQRVVLPGKRAPREPEVMRPD